MNLNSKDRESKFIRIKMPQNVGMSKAIFLQCFLPLFDVMYVMGFFQNPKVERQNFAVEVVESFELTLF